MYLAGKQTYQFAEYLYKNKVVCRNGGDFFVHSFETGTLFSDKGYVYMGFNSNRIDLKVIYFDLDDLEYKKYQEITAHVRGNPKIKTINMYKIGEETYFIDNGCLYKYDRKKCMLIDNIKHHFILEPIYFLENCIIYHNSNLEKKIFLAGFIYQHPTDIIYPFAVDSKTVYFYKTVDIEFQIEDIKFIGKPYFIKRKIVDDWYLCYNCGSEIRCIRNIITDEIIIDGIMDASFYKNHLYVLAKKIVSKYYLPSPTLKIKDYKDLQFRFR